MIPRVEQLSVVLDCPECNSSHALEIEQQHEDLNTHDLIGEKVEQLLAYAINKEGDMLKWGVGNKLYVGETPYRYSLTVFHEGTEPYEKLEEKHQELQENNEG